MDLNLERMTDGGFSSLIGPEDREPWTDEETNALRARLWGLLSLQMSKKTQGDHTSLPVEDAEELMQSVCYTLRLHLNANGLPTRLLLTENINVIFKAAQHTVEARLEETHQLYNAACRTVCDFESRSLRDTLRGIGVFFTTYDFRLYAHQTPSDIDYQLCLPVPVDRQGVTYIRDYLSRLLIENAFLTRFDPARVHALLRRACADYRELPVNLYEPVAACVTGLALLNGGETLLEITAAQGERLSDLLANLSPEKMRDTLEQASADACSRLGIHSAGAARYLAETAESLGPRLLASPESIGGVFSVC